MCAAPARLLGIGARKGAIAPGHDADLVLWDPEAEFVVTEELLLHRHKLTPYLGARLTGVVSSTWVRGECVYTRKHGIEGVYGQLLHRETLHA